MENPVGVQIRALLLPVDFLDGFCHVLCLWCENGIFSDFGD
jgi:hypothetical protein